MADCMHQCLLHVELHLKYFYVCVGRAKKNTIQFSRSKYGVCENLLKNTNVSERENCLALFSARLIITQSTLSFIIACWIAATMTVAANAYMNDPDDLHPVVVTYDERTT